MQSQAHKSNARLQFRTISRWATVAFCTAAVILLAITPGCSKEDVLDPFASYEYFESSLPDIGARTLTIHANGKAELNTYQGTTEIDLGSGNDVEEMIAQLKTSLQSLSKDDWNQQYAKSGAPWFRRLTRIHPEGISELEYHSGAEAPAEAVALMEKFHELVEQILVQQAADKPAS